MPALEFCLPPAELPRLYRQAPFTRRGGRPAGVEMVWHDTAAGDLAEDHLSLCESARAWRLERASPRPGEDWPPGTPAPVIAEAADEAEIGPWPGPLMPIAGFRGQRRTVQLEAAEPASLHVLDGALRGVAQERAVCRIQMRGPAEWLRGLSTQLADTLPIEVPRWSLATEAASLARGRPAPPRRSGAPLVPPHTTVAAAIALVIGHLTDVLLAGAPAACAGETPEAVHAMRVTVRRLRSALSVFRRAADGPAFAAVKPQLHALAAVLGAARDWDVFLAGTGQDVAAAFPGDPRLEAMLAAAAKRRAAEYAALRKELASPAFRRLCVALVQLAALRPWQLEADEEQAKKLDAPAGAYAAALLARQHERMLEPGADIGAMPAGELHALRKQGKRLRYAAEFFAPIYGRRSTRRFVRRVSALQEALGQLNDGATAAGLMDALRGGPDRMFAAGAVQGFTAARSTCARAAIARSWAKFRGAEPFWD